MTVARSLDSSPGPLPASDDAGEEDSVGVAAEGAIPDDCSCAFGVSRKLNEVRQ